MSAVHQNMHNEMYYKLQLRVHNTETNTLPLSCSVCWNTDIEQETQTRTNIRINLRFILGKLRYYTFVYYISDILKARIAHIYQFKKHTNLNYALPQVTR